MTTTELVILESVASAAASPSVPTTRTILDGLVRRRILRESVDHGKPTWTLTATGEAMLEEARQRTQ